MTSRGWKALRNIIRHKAIAALVGVLRWYFINKYIAVHSTRVRGLLGLSDWHDPPIGMITKIHFRYVSDVLLTETEAPKYIGDFKPTVNFEWEVFGFEEMIIPLDYLRYNRKLRQWIFIDKEDENEKD